MTRLDKKMQKKLEQLQAACDDFNARIPVGTNVKLTKDLGHVVETKTRSEAQVLSGHSAAVWLESERGYCAAMIRLFPFFAKRSNSAAIARGRMYLERVL